jgi:hypothetical protein
VLGSSHTQGSRGHCPTASVLHPSELPMLGRVLARALMGSPLPWVSCLVLTVTSEVMTPGLGGDPSSHSLKHTGSPRLEGGKKNSNTGYSGHQYATDL